MGKEARITHKEWGMTRRMVLSGTPEHKVFFRLLFEAFRSRGSAQPEARVSKEDKRLDAGILRALKLVSHPDPDEEKFPAPKDGEFDGRPRLLNEGGGTFDMTQPEHSRLMKFIESTQWLAAMTDVAADLEDWFETAEKVQPPGPKAVEAK